MKGAYTIAIYHYSIKIISRGKGKSAVGAAAYRAGERIKNEYDGVTHDYAYKSGIVFRDILLPDNAPLEYSDRATLWNAVEKIEKAKSSQLAREIEIGIPAELTAIQNRVLIRDYVQHTFVDKGMCADICIHDKKDGNPLIASRAAAHDYAVRDGGLCHCVRGQLCFYVQPDAEHLAGEDGALLVWCPIDDKNRVGVFAPNTDTLRTSEALRELMANETGFGLFYSKTIVEAHGGGVNIKSAEGKGTTIPVYGGQDYRAEQESGEEA